MKRIHPLIPAVFALLVVLVPVGAAAQVAMMNFSSSAVTWSPMIANDGMTLTVSGGGVWFQKSFKSGASPRFDTFDAEGNALADGVYKWELSARPARTAGDRGEWENARTNADGSFVRHGTAPQIEPQSGTFRIANGSIVDPNGATEGGGATGGGIGGIGGGGGKGASGVAGPGTNDQQILDDLIVDGSICVGLDCVNGESFGFDTLRLAENNLRINFKDTSTSASFPSNDWELTANESQNGGQNKFSITDITGGRIPFTVEAGAPSHSLYLDDGGRLGLGTSTPVADVHVVSGNTPTLRLEQNGTSGFTPQTWDLAGNETNLFIRDATNGSKLPFRIRPGAETSMIDISGNDRVGIRDSSPDAVLDVDGKGSDVSLQVDGSASTNINQFRIVNDGAVRFELEDSTDETWVFRNSPCGVPAGTNNSCFRVNPIGVGHDTAFQLEEDGDLFIDGAVSPGSSRSIKENFEPIDPSEVLDRVAGLEITKWTYIQDADDARHIGPMAEDFWAAFGVGPNDKVLSPSDTAGVALAAVQALNEKLAEKDATISSLLERLEALEAKVDQQ